MGADQSGNIKIVHYGIYQLTMSVLTTYTKIRFQDCDPFQHLNNARFIDYFLNARGDQILEHYDIDIYGSQGFSWLVGSNQIVYFKPAMLNEEVCIETQIIAFSSRNIKVEMRMFGVEKKDMKAFLWVDSIPINLKTMRMDTHNDNLMKLFGEATMPIDESSFEDRRRFFLRKH